MWRWRILLHVGEISWRRRCLNGSFLRSSGFLLHCGLRFEDGWRISLWKEEEEEQRQARKELGCNGGSIGSFGRCVGSDMWKEEEGKWDG
jgi:hypothetical protein